jgi:hypothetical protein
VTTPFPFVVGAPLRAEELNDITNLPINDQTASYTLVVGDAGKRVVMNVASANTVTINDSIFGVGDTLEVLNKGAGATTITAGSGVTLNGLSLVLSQYQGASITFLSASVALVFPTGGKSVKTEVTAFTASGTFTVPAGVTYAIAHMVGGGGGSGRSSTAGGTGGTSSVAFAGGTVSATGGLGQGSDGGITSANSSAAGTDNSGQGGKISAIANAGFAAERGDSVTGQDGAYIVAGGAVTPAASITVTVGAGGTAGTGGTAGGSGYVWIEYQV